MERWFGLVLVATAFCLTGTKAALVQRRAPAHGKRLAVRLAAHAAAVITLVALLFGDAGGGCIRLPFWMDWITAMSSGVPLTVLGYAITSALLTRWQQPREFPK